MVLFIELRLSTQRLFGLFILENTVFHINIAIITHKLWIRTRQIRRIETYLRQLFAMQSLLHNFRELLNKYLYFTLSD